MEKILYLLANRKNFIGKAINQFCYLPLIYILILLNEFCLEFEIYIWIKFLLIFWHRPLPPIKQIFFWFTQQKKRYMVPEMLATIIYGTNK